MDIFWDSELWMYPTLLAPTRYGKICLIIVLIVCKEEKKATVYGYKGAMFPWESDDIGEEATPTWALTGILSNILLQMFRSLSGTTMRIHKIKLVEKGMF
jgi:trehalose/maltose hydrolase-like predicted phosphorylase